MPDALREALQGVDLICHAGDVMLPHVLDELSEIAPVVAVRGNNDGDDITAWGAKDVAQWAADGVNIAMIHEGGPRTGRQGRLLQMFPDADLIIYGHSHIPMIDEGNDDVTIVNPGSPTDKRRQPTRTMARVELNNGKVRSVELVHLP